MPESAPTDDVVVLFSGGVNSALAAIRAGRRFRRVRLLTFVHRRVYGEDRVEEQLLPLTRFFGNPKKFTWETLSVEPIVRALMTDGGFAALRRHGFLLLSEEDQSRIAFHLRALHYCRENGIRLVLDGAVRPEADRVTIDDATLRERIGALYQGCGVGYESPIYDEGQAVEETLYALRFSRAPRVRGTGHDTRIRSEWAALERMALGLHGRRYRAEDGRRRRLDFLHARLACAEALAREYRERGDASALAAMAGR